ncbi:MAG: zf-TFIIB domain-containing protein [Candidatus Aureabacteria bacterium]|nr:zf-TFIIB domain-containing protein [Candidatus Auribacterota bacterium]
MFCPKCNEIELEPVQQDKFEYLACQSGCEGVWVSRKALEKLWGKKKLKQLESQLEEIKQPELEEVPLEDIAEVKGKSDFDVLDETASMNLDEDDDDDFDEDYEYEDEEEEKDDEEDDDEEVEEISFDDQRVVDRTYLGEDGDFEDAVDDAADGYSDSNDIIEEEEEDTAEIEETETIFWTSPVSGTPMKIFTYHVTDKLKCTIGLCSESDYYWIDNSEEVLNLELKRKKGVPKTFSALLAYDRPEEEIEEAEDEEDEDEDI